MIICQCFKVSVFVETQQMIQINRVVRDACAALRVDFWELMDLFPEDVFVDSIGFKNGRLYVARDERLVEISDTGDYVLTVEIFFVIAGRPRLLSGCRFSVRH